MQELNSQAQDLVDAGHFDPNAVEETRIVMEERFVRIFLGYFRGKIHTQATTNRLVLTLLWFFSVGSMPWLPHCPRRAWS